MEKDISPTRSQIQHYAKVLAAWYVFLLTEVSKVILRTHYLPRSEFLILIRSRQNNFMGIINSVFINDTKENKGSNHAAHHSVSQN